LYGKGVAANAAAKASILDLYDHKARQTAAMLGTPQAQANYLKLSGDLAAEKQKSLQDAATILSAQPGFKQIGGAPPAQEQQAPAQAAPMAAAPAGGMSKQPEASNKPGYEENPEDENELPAEAPFGRMAQMYGDMPESGALERVSVKHEKEKPISISSMIDPKDYQILDKDANDKYTKSQYDVNFRNNPQDKAKLSDEFERAQKADRLTSALPSVYDDLYNNVRSGGQSDYLRRKANPHALESLIGGVTGGGAALAGAGGPLAAGAGMLGAGIAASMDSILGPMSETK
jgi:hypothetical protein